MIAYRLLNAQTQPEFQEVPEPHAAPGQVLVKVGGSGLCHTDFTVISRDLSYWKDDSAALHARTRDRRLGRRGGSRSKELQEGRRCRGQPVVGELRPLSHVPVRRRKPLPVSIGHSRSGSRL